MRTVTERAVESVAGIENHDLQQIRADFALGYAALHICTYDPVQDTKKIDGLLVEMLDIADDLHIYLGRELSVPSHVLGAFTSLLYPGPADEYGNSYSLLRETEKPCAKFCISRVRGISRNWKTKSV